jgi:hypothetical protein
MGLPVADASMVFGPEVRVGLALRRLSGAGTIFFRLATLLALSWPASAAADLFVAREGENVVAVARRVVIVHQKGRESLVEELEITSSAPRFLWFRAFPVAPLMTSGNEDLLRTLDQQTIVEEPFNEQVRRSLFGPSVVTLLTHRLIGEDRPSTEETYPNDLRKTHVDAPRTFTGRVTTSTITFQLVLPDELALWISEQNLTVTEEQKREMARYLNRDWVLVGTTVTDQAPSDSARAMLGPTRFDFAVKSPIYPQLGIDRPWLRPLSSFYLIADTPMTPATLRTIWDTRPWEPRTRRVSEFVATYSSPIEPDSPLVFAFEEANVALPEKPFLVRATYERGGEALVDLPFVPAQDAIVIPGGDRRNSGTDVFLCILLGLTPLIYTPESWFLLWLAARAKARARKEGRAFGTRLWSVYAIAVAIFWFASLEGAGRLAALAPMLVGIVQLAIPYTERDASPVRVQFKKKKPS